MPLEFSQDLVTACITLAEGHEIVFTTPTHIPLARTSHWVSQLQNEQGEKSTGLGGRRGVWWQLETQRSF
jgi:hypothetical protein